MQTKPMEDRMSPLLENTLAGRLCPQLLAAPLQGGDSLPCLSYSPTNHSPADLSTGTAALEWLLPMAHRADRGAHSPMLAGGPRRTSSGLALILVVVVMWHTYAPKLMSKGGVGNTAKPLPSALPGNRTVLQQPHSRLLSPSALNLTRIESSHGGITLLINFFGNTSTSHGPARYAELLGAIRANIVNPAVSELVVLFDGHCPWLEHALLGPLRGVPRAQLACSEHTGQPTYADMFGFALEQADRNFHGTVVVISNADVVFDQSLAQLPPVPPYIAYLLSVNAQTEAGLYLQMVGFPFCKKDKHWSDNRCLSPADGHRRHRPHPVYGPFSDSWDAVALRIRELPRDFAERARVHRFPLDVHMNQFSAEQRMKCGLEAAGLVVLNACLWVRMQHFHHCGDKTGLGGTKKLLRNRVPLRLCPAHTFPCMLSSYGQRMLSSYLEEGVNEKKMSLSNQWGAKPEEIFAFIAQLHHKRPGTHNDKSFS
eukprot:gene9990-1801_t